MESVVPNKCSEMVLHLVVHCLYRCTSHSCIALTHLPYVYVNVYGVRVCRILEMNLDRNIDRALSSAQMLVNKIKTRLLTQNMPEQIESDTFASGLLRDLEFQLLELFRRIVFRTTNSTNSMHINAITIDAVNIVSIQVVSNIFYIRKSNFAGSYQCPAEFDREITITNTMNFLYLFILLLSVGIVVCAPRPRDRPPSYEQSYREMGAYRRPSPEGPQSPFDSKCSF